MKKIFFTICLAAISSITFSQSLTINNLITNVECSDYDCYNSFITTKGFSYYESSKDDEHTMYTFISDSSIATSAKGVTANEKSSIILTPTATTISYLTPSKKVYTAWITELKAKGYLVVKTEHDDANTVSTYYKNKKIPHKIFLVTTTIDTKDSVNFKIYRIAVTKT